MLAVFSSHYQRAPDRTRERALRQLDILASHAAI
jgi:hypothetical protein